MSTPSSSAGTPIEAIELDLAGNLAARKYSRREQTLRIAWAFGRWLVRLSPHPCHGWRRSVLRLFGARVGPHARIAASAHIVMPWNLEMGEWAAIGPEVLVYNLGKVRIGPRATVSYRSHICAGSHDFTDPTLPLTKPPVTLGHDAWVGTEAFIGPGVTIGAGAMVGARAVVVKDVEARMVVAGHPARVIGERPAMKRREPR